MDRAIITDTFIELGKRLQSFGNDPISSDIIRQAINVNEWFSSSDIMMAVKAIREEMLTEDKLRMWLSCYPTFQTQKRVAIIMAGNLPLVGFFDLLCVLISGHIAIVKPSSKDSVLMNYIIDILCDIYTNIPIESHIDNAPIDMVIATGGDAAATHFRSKYANIPALIRGSRHSVAVLSGTETQKQMDGLRQDIYSYNGLGCRNVSLIFVPKDWEGSIPSPDVIIKMKYGNYLCDKAIATMTGVLYKDLNGAIAVESSSFPSAISRIHYTYYDKLEDVYKWIEEHDEELQCIVSSVVNHPRRTDFGRAQYPSLWDYADGIDIMKFLTT